MQIYVKIVEIKMYSFKVLLNFGEKISFIIILHIDTLLIFLNPCVRIVYNLTNINIMNGVVTL